MALQQPPYALLIPYDRDLRLNIATGQKKTFILEGHHDYQPGPVVLCDYEHIWAVMVDIVEIKHITITQAEQGDLEGSGLLKNQEPSSQLQDIPVTVIRWKNVRGRWATPEGIELFKALR